MHGTTIQRALYRQLPSLQEYLLVAQDRASAELYTRGTEGRWTLTDYRALSDSVRLECIDCTLALSEVYDKVEIARGKDFQLHDRSGAEGV